MKLWLLSQGDHNGYDTFDSMVVAAETEQEARLIHPTETWVFTKEIQGYDYWKNDFTWASSPESVEVKLIGEAVEGTAKGIILASFNAG